MLNEVFMLFYYSMPQKSITVYICVDDTSGEVIIHIISEVYSVTLGM